MYTYRVEDTNHPLSYGLKDEVQRLVEKKGRITIFVIVSTKSKHFPVMFSENVDDARAICDDWNYKRG